MPNESGMDEARQEASTLVDEDWINSFLGNDEDTDISISMGESGEVYEKMGVEIRIPSKLTRSLTRGDVRKIAEFLRSFDDDQRLW